MTDEKTKSKFMWYEVVFHLGRENLQYGEKFSSLEVAEHCAFVDKKTEVYREHAEKITIRSITRIVNAEFQYDKNGERL